MPTNPFDLLKQFALRKVPGAQPPPTEIQEENRDFRAQAIQDAEPTGLRSTGRNAIDAITGFLVDDPFAEPSSSVQKGITKPSAAAWGGQLAAAAPLGIPKRLPIIAPEAYRDVKAGGLRLYSRLTDAFAKAPKTMAPAKARSIASQASKEEIDYRKLSDFLKGHERTPDPAPGHRRLYRIDRPEPANDTLDEIMANTGLNEQEAQQIIDTRGRWFGDDYDYVHENYSGWDARQNPVYVDVPQDLPLENVMANEKLFEAAIPHEWASKKQPYRHADRPVRQEDVMQHLAANPLELGVVRKTSGKQKPYGQADQDLAVFEHELDTEYGAGWDPEQLTPQQQERYAALQNGVEDPANRGVPDEDYARYDRLQTPGPKENYGETLINLPASKDAVNARTTYNQLYDDTRDLQPHMLSERYDDLVEAAPHLREMTDNAHRNLKDVEARDVFQSSHWEEPNNLVWTRHNERRLNPTSVETDYGSGRSGSGQGDFGQVAEGGSPGLFTEEIQSDWHQQGREHGYRTPEVEAEYANAEAIRSTLNQQMNEINKWPTGDGGEFKQATDRISSTGFDPLDDDGYSYPYANMKELLDDYEQTPQKFQGLLSPEEHNTLNKYLELRKTEEANFRHYVMDKPISSMVPDAPFKDTYHELAIKADLLDAAERPDLEWYGIADADTVSAMEGHSSVKPGTELYYNQKHPSALEKLLSPLGGSVEKAELPHDPSKLWADPNVPASKPPGMWKAPLPPELKELIKTRGFPAMAALLALQQSLIPRQEPD